VPRNSADYAFLTPRRRKWVEAYTRTACRAQAPARCECLGERLALEIGQRFAQIAGRDPSAFISDFTRHWIDRRIGEVQQREELEIRCLEIFPPHGARPGRGDGRELRGGDIAGHIGGCHGRRATWSAPPARGWDCRSTSRIRRLGGSTWATCPTPRSIPYAPRSSDAGRCAADAPQCRSLFTRARVVVDAKRRSVASATSRKNRSISILAQNVSGCCENGAVGAVARGEADIGDRRLGVVAGTAEEIGMRGVFIFAVSTMISLFPPARASTSRRSIP